MFDTTILPRRFVFFRRIYEVESICKCVGQASLFHAYDFFGSTLKILNLSTSTQYVTAGRPTLDRDLCDMLVSAPLSKFLFCVSLFFYSYYSISCAVGRGCWKVASFMEGRTSKQCRERWCHHLDPAVRKGGYTTEEDDLIIILQVTQNEVVRPFSGPSVAL